MGSLLWWIKNILMALVSVFFLIFGITNLSHSYNLKNPLEFVMTFFSASLMLMISIVGVIYVIFRIYSFIEEERGKKDE